MNVRTARAVSEAIVVAPRRPEIHLTIEQLATAAGLRPAVVARLVRLGVLEPDGQSAGEFTALAAARLRRMLRLRRDLGVNLAGAAIIVDLVERLGTPERERQRRGGP
jgi:chaperone modulatory protein CbpM